MRLERSDEVLLGYTRGELASIAAIVATVSVLGWFMTDTTGQTRLVSVAISALGALLVAAVGFRLFGASIPS